MEFLLVTNNELVRAQYENLHPLLFIEGNDRAVMTRLRDFVHEGHTLLSHPLCGSVKPGETPFRSVLISKETKGNVDPVSLDLIESCMAALDKFRVRYEGQTEKVLDDFRAIDLSIIESAVPRAVADQTGRF